MNLTEAIYDRLSGDAELAGLLASYEGGPAIFTVDPAPGNASLPYIVSAGTTSQRPFEAKNQAGREMFRDIRCYSADTGSAETVEAMAERVRALLHRHRLVIDGFSTLVAEVSGPVTADEDDAYGRIVSLRLIAMASDLESGS